MAGRNLNPLSNSGDTILNYAVKSVTVLINSIRSQKAENLFYFVGGNG